MNPFTAIRCITINNIQKKKTVMKTNPFNRVLIPTDFSKTSLLAVEHAAFMAQLSKADLYVLHAIEISDSAFWIYNPAILFKDNSAIEKIASAKLKELALKIQKQYGITTKTICTTGYATAEIAKAVAEHDIDIVVMGTHGAHGFNELFAGSNAHKTVTICPCPVITVQIHARKSGFTRIVLPIDDCFDSRQKVNFTVRLAKLYSAKIYVLGLLEKSEDTDMDKFKVKLKSVEKALTKAGLACEIKTVKSGNLAEAALRFSKRVKADLISVLTDHESNLTGMFLGAFAKQIVNHSRIPVLSIRPAELGVYDSVSLAGSNAN